MMRPLVRPLRIENIITVSEFHHPHITALVHEAKFHGNRYAWTLLGELLSRYIEEERVLYDIIIPIPLSKKRVRRRGYNQVLQIIHNAHAINQSCVQPKLLVRVRDTAPQTTLSRTERHSNIAGAFDVPKPRLLEGKHVLVIDDVLTTGATLRAAEKALMKHAPASISLLALAH
jgi:ComF family protein